MKQIKISSLNAYEQVHNGKTIVVCGCGTSLKDLSNPEKYITIGVNDVGRLFDPTYLVVLNRKQQFKGNRFQYIESSKANVIFSQLNLNIKHNNIVQFRLGERGGNKGIE